jgi:hypothetical protein
MSLNSLKTDFLRMLKLQAEISKYEEMSLHHSDINDKKNYDFEKIRKIRSKLNELYDIFNPLYDKWFG